MPDDELFNLIETEERDEDTAPAPADSTLGERLRARRRQQGLSLYQAAQELRADPAMLRAIEADDFGSLGAPVYIKGHLRKYAGLLGLSPDEVFADYLRTHELKENAPVVNRVADPGRPYRKPRWLGPFLMLLLVLALGAAIAWWVSRDTPDDDGTTTAVSSTAGTTSPPVPLTGFPPMPAVGEMAEPPVVPEDAADEPAPVREALPGDEALPADEALRIDLIFVGDSWAEVTDADGQRLVFGLMHAGRTQSVLGVPPVEVLLGDAGAVRLQVNGRSRDIAPGDVRGGVARFSISGP